MRIILKIIAAPAVLALTLIVALLNFSVSLASWVLGILSLILAVCGLFELFIQSNPQWGITGLVLAFLLSPFGLPAAAEWLVCRLDNLNYSLKTFIAGCRFGTICPEVLCGGWSTAAVFFQKGGAAIATTYIRPYKVAAGKTAVQTMEDRFAYGLNPKKIGAVSAYLCDPASAPAEFLLTKSQYQAETGRAVERGALFCQIRQAFPPGEVTPEEANKIGYETAMRWTKGKYQFFVCTHIDKGHIHNHIYYNSTAQDCSRKFHNFIGSSFAVRRLSDRVCIEHELSVIQNPKQHSKGRFLHYGQWIGEKPPSAQQRVRWAIVEALGKKPADFPAFLRLMEESGFAVKHGRGGVISFLAPGQDKYTRLRASVLGPGFDPDDIRAVIAGERPIPEIPKDGPAPPRRVNLIIDIQERMAQGKGPAYARWAKVYNLKQMAAALQYLQEHKLTNYEELAASTEAAVDRFHALAGALRETEAALSHTVQLMGATVDFAKTRPVFDGYKAARYSRKYLAQHEAELAAYRAAKAAMNDLLGGAKLPKMDTLKKERRELSEKKKALYAEYRKAQADMRQAVAVKANIDYLLGHTDGRENKAQER